MTTRCELKPVPVPPISHQYSTDGSDLELELDDSQLHNVLTDTVRHQYYRYLQKSLKNNYATARPTQAPTAPEFDAHCRRLEERAIRSCMILHLYRRSILKIIGQIRCDTEHGKLFDLHAGSSIRTSESSAACGVNQATQTEDIAVAVVQLPQPAMVRESLHARLKRIAREQPTLMADSDGRTMPPHSSGNYKRHKDHDRRRMSSRSRHRSIRQAPPKQPTPVRKPPVVMPITPQPTISDDDDDLFKQMSEICGSIESPSTFTAAAAAPTDLVAEIFGDGPTDGAVATHQQQPSQNASDLCESNNHQPHEITRAADNLQNSLWPCELHMQRLRLQAALSQYAASGWEHTERLRLRFIELFGEEDYDDDDVFAPYSPTLELNPVLMASCKRRIAPWIVRHLMAPLSDGLIANRFLFKRLAKHLAERIIIVDQFPDELLIRDVVAEFFCMHPLVRTLEDIE